MRTNGPQAHAGRRTAGAVLALVATAALLSGCGGSNGSGTSGSAADSAGKEAAPTPGDADKPGSDQSAAGSPRTDARVLPAGRDIVYRGQISVRVKDVAIAADRAESLARSVDGVVFAEETSNMSGSPDESTASLTVRVPPAEFRAVLRKLAGLGERLSQSQTAEDVTTQVVDTRSRVASQTRSVARVRALLAKANTIGEVVQIESELAKREADLESLQAQLARLQDVTELATIEVTFVGPTAAVAQSEPDLGFLAGLRGGWNAFVSIVLVGLTVLGALLPFLVAAALLGVPARLVLRTRLVRRPQTP